MTHVDAEMTKEKTTVWRYGRDRRSVRSYNTVREREMIRSALSWNTVSSSHLTHLWIYKTLNPRDRELKWHSVFPACPSDVTGQDKQSRPAAAAGLMQNCVFPFSFFEFACKGQALDLNWNPAALTLWGFQLLPWMTHNVLTFTFTAGNTHTRCTLSLTCIYRVCPLRSVLSDLESEQTCLCLCLCLCSVDLWKQISPLPVKLSWLLCSVFHIHTVCQHIEESCSPFTPTNHHPHH